MEREALEFRNPVFWGDFGAFFTIFSPEDSLRLMMFLVNPTTWTDMERILTQLQPWVKLVDFVGDGKENKTTNPRESPEDLNFIREKLRKGSMKFTVVVFLMHLKSKKCIFITYGYTCMEGKMENIWFVLSANFVSTMVSCFFSSPWVLTRESFPVKAVSWVTQGLGMLRHRHGTSEVYALDLVWLVARLLVTGRCFFLSNAAMEGTLPGEVHITTCCFLAR